MPNTLKAPKAKIIPKTLEKHGDIRIDNYHWLNDRTNPEVISYLEEENNYCKEILSHTEDFKADLFEEMKSRIKKDDQSVPYKYNGYWYIVKFEDGKDYPIYLRRKHSINADDELLFDCNEMAKGYSYFKLVGISISPDNKLVSYAIDTSGRRIYTICVKEIKSHKLLDTNIENTTGRGVWANDNVTLFYCTKNKKTLRSEKIYKHKINSSTQDILVYEEKDETFGVSISKSKSRDFLYISSYHSITSEYRFLDANTPDEDFKLIAPRQRGIEYDVSHYNEYFYILTNADKATNFKLIKTPVNATSTDNWKEVIAHRQDVLLEDIDIFKDFLVISERENGLNKIRVKRWDNTEEYYLPFDNETYTAYTTTNIDFDTQILRYSYNSLNTPASVIDFDMVNRTKTIKKEQEVLGGKFKKDNYKTKRIWATAEDDTKIPISLIYHKNTKLSKSTPLVIYAYGSYGSTIDPYFSSIRLSLLDRGFIYAIAHVRGGEYLGRDWYEKGKLLHKKNTFTDFVASTKFLHEIGFSSPEHTYAIGGSAGGLLIGVIVNSNPELYNGVIAQVPFVDVVTTMLDDSIPLTTGEYDEWGNPNQKIYYDYMKSYSPYDNVREQKYPNMLVTAGLHDSQVQYWEPAKWVAKLRATKVTNNTVLILHTNMKAGHSGASGRFESLKEVALEYIFLLELENIKI